ncbi:MAG: hypothetical protein HKO66_04050, partial [Saprospiraceae bacterium]|nr:hypothetical protein [Bacteroidia bacterium]NNL91383.1 hypothetical protein [Saprospiraceae bacterium]
FADDQPVSAEIEIFNLNYTENTVTGSLEVVKEPTTNSTENHYEFCEVDQEGLITGNALATYLVSIEYQSSNLANRKENFELLFAIVEPHNSSIAHDHHVTTTNPNTANARQTSEVITESEIADLSTSSLDQLRNLNNSSGHIAEHIELIPFTVCYPRIGDGVEIDINEANHGRGH